MKKLLLAATLAMLPLALVAQTYGPGNGPGRAQGPRGPMMSADAMPGRSLMTPEERTAHQEKMRSFTDQAACRSYMQEHHRMLDARAHEQGKSLPRSEAGPYCERLRVAR
jgi:hypothetical protein